MTSQFLKTAPDPFDPFHHIIAHDALLLYPSRSAEAADDFEPAASLTKKVRPLPSCGNDNSYIKPFVNLFKCGLKRTKKTHAAVWRGFSFRKMSTSPAPDEGMCETDR